MEKDYDYHKRNDYPGERVDEKKRVADRDDAADKRSDARVAEKGRTDELKADNRVAKRGRMDDELMDSEIERSTARAQGVNRARNTADTVLLITVAGVLIILILGFAWNAMAIRQQSNEIDSLKAQLAVAPTLTTIELSNANKQIQLYKDFLVLTADVKNEVKALENYNGSYSSSYQFCVNYMERDNNINLAMGRFAEKEIIYYNQIAILADKAQCKAKITTLSDAMAASKAADETLYLQNRNECNRLMTNQTSESTKLQIDWGAASDDAKAKAASFTAAEKDVIACFA